MPSEEHVELPPTIINFQLANLVNTFTAFIEEIAKSQSAAQTKYTVPDKARLDAFISAADANVEFLGAEGRNDLDFPKIHGRQFPIEEILAPDDDVMVAITNPHIQQVVYYWEAFRYEMSHSQSAGMPTGLNTHDYNRAKAIIGDLTAYKAEIIDELDPLDFPVAASPSGTGTGD